MMTTYLLALASLLLVCLLVGMVRVLRGPTVEDRMLTAQLFGTVGVAILVLLSFVSQSFSLLNVALILALLAPLSLLAFVQLVEVKDESA
ncbi:MAG: multicomponent Na+:H+ antiporter subunit F [Paraglaciecola sp.]|jgi:multicomponent Na+:H+ antiporter subunit F